MFRLMVQAILSTAGLGTASMAASQDAALPAPVLAGALVAMAAAAVFIWFGPHLWRRLRRTYPRKAPAVSAGQR